MRMFPSTITPPHIPLMRREMRRKRRGQVLSLDAFEPRLLLSNAGQVFLPDPGTDCLTEEQGRQIVMPSIEAAIGNSSLTETLQAPSDSTSQTFSGPTRQDTCFSTPANNVSSTFFQGSYFDLIVDPSNSNQAIVSVDGTAQYVPLTSGLLQFNGIDTGDSCLTVDYDNGNRVHNTLGGFCVRGS